MVRQYDLYLFFLEQGLERLYLKVFDHIRGGGGGYSEHPIPHPQRNTLNPVLVVVSTPA